jgi:NAD+ diphosphatase
MVAYARGIAHWHRNQRFARLRRPALASTIRTDNSEVLEARWFTAPELRARIADPALGGPYRVDSIGRFLIEDCLASQA